ncbi:hypothetical protein BD410DRAFT_817250 [Rickenella mellea]|uniref:2OGFeDO JBP1/TET oxygenase domain-containing protein n=1 Tax=Rickenella mellea TaxID=50990 RepID=A0A4Y7PGH1_9AGAM|nr:hypothetical protein BD410DRAFT_817250 [Rickenella mellea]
MGYRGAVEVDRSSYTLDDVLGMGLTLVPWDGRTPKPLVDSENRVLGVLAGQPKDEGWAGVATDAFDAIQDERGRMSFSDKQVNHRRGDFPAVGVGVSYGGGQRAPGNLDHSELNRRALNRLLNRRSIIRIAGFGNRAFQMFAPKLHSFYETELSHLYAENPSLRQNFKGSVFPAITINLGNQVACIPHTDSANLAWGWCVITALGDFDPKRSGHLILWDLGLVVEFPPGSTILIPSAILRHSNVRLQPGESRSSVTQYAAAGLFRWVSNGFVSDKVLKASDPEAFAERDARRTCRWMKGLEMWSKLSDFTSQTE